MVTRAVLFLYWNIRTGLRLHGVIEKLLNLALFVPMMVKYLSRGEYSGTCFEALAVLKLT